MRAELSSCSRWLTLSLSRVYCPRVILAVGATAASLFYRDNTLSSAIERSALRGHLPQCSIADRESLHVVPMPQIASLSAHRRSIDRKPWADIANEQLSIALELVRQTIQASR
jgi:uracil-DNA glycosylase